MMFTNTEFERLYEVLTEAKEAITLAKEALKKKTIDERQIEASFEDVPPLVSNVIHILPKTIIDFNAVQSQKLKLVPDVTDLLSKLCEDLCLVVVLNRQHLKNKGVRRHIEEMLTVTVMVAKILQEETGKRVSGPGDQGPSIA
jgi:hypothetical protein